MKTPEFPKKVAKGSCTVTIYEREYEKQDKDGLKKRYVEYTLAWYEGRNRRREVSSDYLALRTRADEVLSDLNEGRRGGGALLASERTDFLQAMDLLRPTRQSLHVAVRHYAKAVEILGEDMVIAAAQEYAKRHRSIEQRLVSEVVTEFLDEKRKANKSDRHIQTLQSHLHRFGASLVMHIGAITALEIDAFLDSLKKHGKAVGVRTRDNHADSIVSLCQWAKKKRYLPFDFDEASRITRLNSDEDGPIEIYSVREMVAMLAIADAKLIPFLTIGAFAGLRSSEIIRLDWSDVKMETDSSAIVVQKGKVKKRGKARRIVPMSENLSAWLKPLAQASGSVWPFSVPYLYEMIGELVPLAQKKLQESDSKAKLGWKSNALRHSCISYRVALIKNVPQVALESGNSPQMIDSHYRELVTEQDAKKWFAIQPGQNSA